VVFTNADGKGTQEAEIQPDGSYKIERMPAGPARVAVMTTPVGGGGGQTGPPGRGGGGPPNPMAPPPHNVPPGVHPGKLYGGGQPETKKAVKIPETYADQEKSGLKFTVVRGANEWDIPLK